MGLAVVIGLLAPSPVRADGVSAIRGSTERHRCPCGMDCGAVCCCKHKTGRKTDTADLPARTESGTKAKAVAGPCVRSLPCGGAIPPGEPVTIAFGEKADRTPGLTPRPEPSTGRLAPPRSDRGRTRTEVPTDEPPERFDA